MAEVNSSSPQIQVDALPAAYHAAVETVKTMGLSAAELTAVFSQHVSAECLQCGIQVTGDELGQLALASPEAPLSEPRLARLQQGYCARKDCNSYYYRLLFQEHPKVDWTSVAAAVAGTPAPVPATTLSSKAQANRLWFLEDPRLRRIAIGIGILLALLVIRHVATGGRLPFGHRSPQYTVDPASVSEVPLDRATTNRTAKP